MVGVESHEVRFQCPKCGHDLKQTIGRLKANEHMTCPGCVWRNAPTLPKAEQLKALRNAELHAHLARALDADPDLGRTKSLSESATPT